MEMWIIAIKNAGRMTDGTQHVTYIVYGINNMIFHRKSKHIQINV